MEAAREDLPHIRELADVSPVFNTLMHRARVDVQVQPARAGDRARFAGVNDTGRSSESTSPTTAP